jgi:transcriptional regulator with XRE-family HTH domain
MEFEPFVKYILKKITRLKDERGWTIYRLAQESGINSQTIHNWFERGAMPTLKYLHEVCKAFGITLAEFFAENDLVEVTSETKTLYDEWCALSPDEQAAVKAILKVKKNH